MNANQSSLIPFNLTNDKLEDDNFVKSNNTNANEQKEFFIEGFEDANLIENYESDSNDEESKEESQESQESIESFSNMNFKCPVVIGDKFSFAYTSATGNTSNCGTYGCRVAKLSEDHITMEHGGKYPQQFIIVFGGKYGNILSYGESFWLFHATKRNYLSNTSEGIQPQNIRGGSWVFYFLPAPDSGKKIGDVVHFNDKVIISNSKDINSKSYSFNSNRRLILSNEKTAFYLRRPKGSPCKVQVAKMIYNGDYRIKKITVRCDDKFDMWIGGKKYSGSGWRSIFRFYNVPCNPKGFNIGFKCYNGGGPGCLIACIELHNGSVIFTDETWKAANTPITNEEFFLKNTNNYYFGKSWISPNVIGYNRNDNLKWNGRLIKWRDRYFVDKRFSPMAKWIWAGSCFKKGYTYFSKTIGESPRSARCRENLTFGQALCYMEGNPIVREYVETALSPNKYIYNKKYMSWYDHETEAKKRGGHLVCINSAEENNYIRDTYLKKSPTYWGVWIGAIRFGNSSYSSSSNTWKWSDGSSWKYHNFCRSGGRCYEPNSKHENRAHMWKHGIYGSWNDIRGYVRMPGVYKLPDRSKKININDAVRVAQEHWKLYGCTTRMNLDYKCAKPPETIGNFGYKGCYNNNFQQTLLPNNRGTVTSLGACHDLAEKNREMLYGVTNGDQCYTSNNLKEATKNGIATYCPTMGKRYAYQLYQRKKPYNPSLAKISEKNFSDKIEHFDNNMKNNKSIYIILIIVLLVILYYYFSN
jgi:hypothetical protein